MTPEERRRAKQARAAIYVDTVVRNQNPPPDEWDAADAMQLTAYQDLINSGVPVEEVVRLLTLGQAQGSKRRP